MTLSGLTTSYYSCIRVDYEVAFLHTATREWKYMYLKVLVPGILEIY